MGTRTLDDFNLAGRHGAPPAALLGVLTGTTRQYGRASHQFTAFLSSGTFQVLVAGVLDLLVQAGGAAGSSSRAGGAGGQIRRRVWVEPGTYNVVVGPGGSSPGADGGLSRIEDLVAIPGGGLTNVASALAGSACGGGFSNNVTGQGYPSNGTWGAGGAGGTNNGNTGGPGVVWLDGNTYGVGGSSATGGAGAANTGNGGEGTNLNGGSGIVILGQPL